jgi:hypothetical protein
MPPLKAFATYVGGLEVLATDLMSAREPINQNEQVIAALDGGTSAALRRVVPILERRKMGAFFTPSVMAGEAVLFFEGPLPDDAVFMDPACGAGDLLIAVARQLSLEHDLGSTLRAWGQQLIGFDLQPEFIQATKIRLILTALERGARLGATPLPTEEDLFPYIRVGDGLSQIDFFRRATHIILNPPFPKTVVEKCSWASEKVSAAAIFIDACVSHARPGTKIVAILPDVLRSGSNYRRWRGYIVSKASVEATEVCGEFDTWTDVNVFKLRLTVGPGTGLFEGPEWWEDEAEGDTVVGDLFDIKVGRVVPYRDPEVGPLYPYIYPRVLPQWAVVNVFPHRRRFSGEVFSPPFVAVRRTSRPSHQYRAVGTIISGSRDVAVENHLIVLSPLDGFVKTCQGLLRALRTQETNDWLNDRIRCRHLTVPAIRDLPLRVNL